MSKCYQFRFTIGGQEFTSTPIRSKTEMMQKKEKLEGTKGVTDVQLITLK